VHARRLPTEDAIFVLTSLAQGAVSRWYAGYFFVGSIPPLQYSLVVLGSGRVARSFLRLLLELFTCTVLDFFRT